MSKSVKYHEDFQRLWSCWLAMQKSLSLGKAGSKQQAYAEWLNTADLPGPDDLINTFRDQCKEKLMERAMGNEPHPFKHCCRWLKHREWEPDDIEGSVDFLQSLLSDDDVKTAYSDGSSVVSIQQKAGVKNATGRRSYQSKSEAADQATRDYLSRQ